MPELMAALAIVPGFADLVWSADRFVAGSAALALEMEAAVFFRDYLAMPAITPLLVVAISARLCASGKRRAWAAASACSCRSVTRPITGYCSNINPHFYTQHALSLQPGKGWA